MNKPITAYAIYDGAGECLVHTICATKSAAWKAAGYAPSLRPIFQRHTCKPVTICPEGWVAVDPSTHDIFPKTAMSITVMEQAERYRAEMANKFVLVPKEPTDEMISAAWRATPVGKTKDMCIRKIYQTMIKQLEGADNE